MRQCGAGRRRTSCGDSVDRPVVPVVRDVVKGDVDTQGVFQLYHFEYEDLPLRSLRPSAFLREHRVCQLRPPRRLPAGSAAGRLARSRWRRACGARRCRRRSTGYRLCQNDKIEGICNWAVPADDDNPLCVSCRLTRVIPNLADPANRAAWYRLEAAKRRLLFTLIELGLPMANRIDDPERRAGVRVPRRCRPERRAGADRPRRRRHHRQHRRGRRRRARAAAGGDARAVSDAARTHAARERSLLLGSPDRGTRRSSTSSGRCSATSAPTTPRRSARTTSSGAPADWQDAVRQRVRERASVGGLGRDVGALSAHGRHARDGRRVRSVAEAAAPRRAGAAGRRRSRCRRSRPRSSG